MRCETRGTPLMLVLRADTPEEGHLLSSLHEALNRSLLRQQLLVSLPIGDPVMELAITYPTR